MAQLLEVSSGERSLVFRAKTIRLEPGTTKNEEGRTFPQNDISFLLSPDLSGREMEDASTNPGEAGGTFLSGRYTTENKWCRRQGSNLHSPRIMSE